MKEAVIIASGGSRHGTEYAGKARDLLDAQGIRVTEFHIVEGRKAVRKRVTQAVRSGFKLVVVIGGDGAQSAAAGCLAFSDAVLGLIPGGTGNSFSLTLGIGEGLERAVDVIVNGKETKVGIGCINDEYFANFASIGIIAEVANDTSKPLKRVLGAVAYGVAGIKPLITHRPFEADVRWDKNRLKVETFQIIIAAGRYYGHEALTPDASAVDGELKVFLPTGGTRMDVVKTNLALIRGQQTHLPNAHYFSAKKLKITTSPRQEVNVDGHRLCRTPITARPVRKALRVMVPRDFTGVE
ncbi:MAG: YegS/Rv2252/BmrU family lipid kinase [Candidatus Eremiobacteraeota bacterium]|nr:YegS/Rv2252/BmrU family lipid kinase [Candidatus Eremiobacteraeota bacterium]